MPAADEHAPRRCPTITDLISLPMPSGASVAPGGRFVAHLESRANWKDNRHETACFVHDVETGRSHRLTRSGSVSHMRWLGVDTLAMLRTDYDGADDDGGPQVWLYEGLVGEGWPVTDHEGGVSGFEPFANGLVFKAPHPERRTRKSREERFGSFVHQEREDSADALYYVDLDRLRAYREAVRRCSREEDEKKLQKPVVELSALLPEPMTIGSFVVSRQGDAVYLTCRERDDLVYLDDTVCYRIALDPEHALVEQLRRDAGGGEDREAREGGVGDGATDEAAGGEDVSHLGTLTRIALRPGASIDAVSPDGSRILVRDRIRDRKWYTQADLFALDVTAPSTALDDDGIVDEMVLLTRGLDQEPLFVRWADAGVFVSVVEGTGSAIYHVAESGAPSALDVGDVYPSPLFEISDDGGLGLTAASADQVYEVYTARVDASASVTAVRRITDYQRLVAAYELGTVETVRWQSRDGTEIEGVLRKPPGYEPGRRYPLVFVVHGGPSWVSREHLLDGDDLRYYPSVALAARGVLVLKPNYRGSLGRGQSFLELNARNLGVGDLWDLESAVDGLAEEGIVDRDRVGCMGWSQGGYISAMAANHSRYFRAVSVGAGISDWYTYQVSNDIPQFTTHYLDASPFDDREIYRATAPIEGLSEDTAPTLIQHGAKDQRVPLSNAMELFRGLQAKGVPVELFVYPEMGHPITKPRENRAVMWQNLTWFAHHLLGDELDFFDLPDEAVARPRATAAPRGLASDVEPEGA